MKRYAFTMLLVVGLLALPWGSAFAATDLATFAPADTLGLFSFNYSKESADRIQKSNLYMMLASEEFAETFQEFMGLIPDKGKAEAALTKVGFKWNDLLALKYGGFCVSFALRASAPPEKSGPPSEPGQPAAQEQVLAPPTPEIALYLDGANPEIKGLTDKLIKLMEQFSEGEEPVFKKSDIKIGAIDAKLYEVLNRKGDEPAEIVVFVSGDVTVFAAGKECATKIVDCITGQGKGSLAQTELFTKTTGKLDARRMTTFFLNSGAIWGLVKEQKVVRQPVFDALHLDSVQVIAHGMWADEAGTFTNTYIYCPDGKFFLLKLLQGGREEFETMSGVGAHAFFAVSVSLDPSDLYDYLLAMMKQGDPNTFEQATSAINQVEQRIGLKIKDDILGALGGETTVVMSAPTLTFDSQFVPVPAGIIVNIKDKDKLNKALDTLCAKFDMKSRMEKYGEAGHELQILPYFVVCETEKQCIFATSVRTMQDILDVMDGKAPRLVDIARFKAARQMLGDKAAVLCYFNVKDTMLALAMACRWGTAAQLMRGKMHAGAQPPDAQQSKVTPMYKIMKEMVKLCDLIGRYFPDSYSAITGEADGISIKTASPNP